MNPIWTGHCTGCHKNGLVVSSRRDHYERVLCDRCAAKPHEMPRAYASDFLPGVRKGTR